MNYLKNTFEPGITSKILSVKKNEMKPDKWYHGDKWYQRQNAVLLTSSL